MITHHTSLENFHQQIDFAINNYKPHGFNTSQFSNIIIGGMGGSGIGGKIIRSYFSDAMPIPVEVVSDYTLPAYVNEKTLVILSSYSGNTEETLQLFQEAKARNCTFLVVAAGGELLELSKTHGITHNVIESGYQPRMTLGYSLTFLVKIFAELTGKDLDTELREIEASLKEVERHKSMAYDLIKKFESTLKNKFVIVADAAFEGVAIRFAQQFNENAKCEAFVSLLPEANHNVIESYYGKLTGNYILLSSNRNERVSARFDFVSSLLERENNKLIFIEADDFSLRTVYETIYSFDWFTILITEPLGVNPMNIDNIVSLKEYMAEV